MPGAWQAPEVATLSAYQQLSASSSSSTSLSVSVECYHHPWVDGRPSVCSALLCSAYNEPQISWAVIDIPPRPLWSAVWESHFRLGFLIYFWGHPYVILCGSVSNCLSRVFISVRELMGGVIRSGRGLEKLKFRGCSIKHKKGDTLNFVFNTGKMVLTKNSNRNPTNIDLKWS